MSADKRAERRVKRWRKIADGSSYRKRRRVISSQGKILIELRAIRTILTRIAGALS